MPEPLHIVCLDAPGPPDYGGSIDMFYKIPALYELGRKITLHYFDYKKERSVDALRPFCHAVHSYQRSSFVRALVTGLPYTVSSRINTELIERLNKDADPVLLEGFHCSGILPYIRKQTRKVAIRVHNDEAQYYLQLSKTERSLLKRVYLKRESRLFHQYQGKLHPGASLACLSQKDAELFAAMHRPRAVRFVPTFLPWQAVTSLPGTGNYLLYHGNLGISENEKAVKWLIQTVFSELDIPFMIAGKDASASLRAVIDQCKNGQLVSNPSASQLDELIRHAHIHVLPSMNTTGVKLKLLHALFMGRFCLTNFAGMAGSALETQAFVAHTSGEFISSIQELMKRSFGQNDIAHRQRIFEIYNNRQNAEALSALL